MDSVCMCRLKKNEKTLRLRGRDSVTTWELAAAYVCTCWRVGSASSACA